MAKEKGRQEFAKRELIHDKAISAQQLHAEKLNLFGVQPSLFS